MDDIRLQYNFPDGFSYSFFKAHPSEATKNRSDIEIYKTPVRKMQKQIYSNTRRVSGLVFWDIKKTMCFFVGFWVRIPPPSSSTATTPPRLENALGILYRPHYNMLINIMSTKVFLGLRSNRPTV